MSLHFGGVTVYTYGNDTIVIETDSETDSETEDAKKESKLISLYQINSGIESIENKRQVVLVHSSWNMPIMEVTSPPPDVS